MEYVIYPHNNPFGSISAYMEIHSGSLDEMDNQLGIAHFCEHVTYMGSRKRQELLRHSIKTNAFTDFHHTVFYATTSDSLHLKSIFEALEDVLKGENQFTMDRLEKERAAILSEASIIDTQEYRKNCATVKTLHSDNLLCKRFPIGSLNELEKYQIDQLKEYHLHNYTPANATIFLIGDVDSSILPLMNDILGQFNRKGRIKLPIDERINHNFNKETEYNVWANPSTNYISCELLRKQPIKAIKTIDDLRLNVLRKIILKGLSYNFDICHRGSSYITCNANDFDCVNEGCRIQNISLKSSESNWKSALHSAIDHLHGMNFNSFIWNNIVSSHLLETDKLLPKNLELKDLVPLVMEYWSCGHVLMDLIDYSECIKQICKSLDPHQANEEFDKMLQCVINPHAVVASSTSNTEINASDLREALSNVSINRDSINLESNDDLSFDSLVTEDELNGLRERARAVTMDKNDHFGVSLYDFGSGCIASYKNLKPNDNSFHIKITIPITTNRLDGELLLASQTMMEGGAIASKTRKQVEMYCCSNLINVNIDMDSEFITISLSSNYSMLESMLQLTHYLLSESRLEKDAFERGKLKLKTMLYDLKTSLHELSIAKSLESLYPNKSLLSLNNDMIESYDFDNVQRLLREAISSNRIHISLVGPDPTSRMDEFVKLYIGTIRHKNIESNNKYITSNILSNNQIIRFKFDDGNETRAAVTFTGHSPNIDGILPNGESIFKNLKENGYNRNVNTSIIRSYGILIQELLGARAFATLREEQKLTYETLVNVVTPINNNYGFYTITVNCIPQNIDRVISAGLNMLKEIRTSRPFTQYQLDRVKSQLLDPNRLSLPTHWIDLLTMAQGNKSLLNDHIANISSDELSYVFNNLYGTSENSINTIIITMK